MTEAPHSAGEEIALQAPPKAPFLWVALIWGLFGTLSQLLVLPHESLVPFLVLWAMASASFFGWWGALDYFRIFLSGKKDLKTHLLLFCSVTFKVVSLIVLIKLIWLWRKVPVMTLLSATMTLVVVPLAGGAIYAWRTRV